MTYLKLIFINLLFVSKLIGQGNTLADFQADTTVYRIVDIEPQFPGGKDSLNKFIRKNLMYPPQGLCDFYGTIYVEFIIEKSGKPSNPKIKKGLSEYHDKEVLRVISLVPNWQPGRLNDKIVRTVQIVPVKFR